MSTLIGGSYQPRGLRNRLVLKFAIDKGQKQTCPLYIFNAGAVARDFKRADFSSDSLG